MKKAFTLIEIMLLVAIIGLLAAMFIPAVNKVRESSKQKQELRVDPWNSPVTQVPQSVPKEITINGRLYRLVE